MLGERFLNVCELIDFCFSAFLLEVFFSFSTFTTLNY